MRRFTATTVAWALAAACGASDTEPAVVLTPDPQPSPTTEPALELTGSTVAQDEATFVLVVAHAPFGLFPSSARKTMTGLPSFAADQTLVSVVYTGVFGRDGQVVDLAEMIADGDAYVAETGLLGDGEVREALLVITGDVPSDLGSGTVADLWQFVANDARVDLAVTINDIETGQVKDFEVTAAEGELFSGTVVLLPILPP